MNSWSRNGGYYKCPVVKSLLVLTGASSLIDYILSVRNYYSSGLLLVHVWSLPTPGMWLLAAMIFYYCRVLERRDSSTKFLGSLCLSCVVGMGAAGLIVLATGVQLFGSQGALVHTLVGVLLVRYLTTVMPAYRSTIAGLSLSGNIPFYLLCTYFTIGSVPTFLLTFCGMVGGLLVYSTGLRIPSLPLWVESGLVRLFGKDMPPKQYSGATLQVQRQQRMDEMETMFQQMQRRQLFQQVRIGGPIQVQPPEPPAAQVEQLMGMGFSREDSVRALLHTGSNLEAAVQLLTTAQQ